MVITGLETYDTVNYKKPAMFIGTSRCSGKCGEACQNKKLMSGCYSIEIDDQELICYYIQNPLTHAVVIGGLEPFDSYIELCKFMYAFRQVSTDDIVIYTGYDKEEIKGWVNAIRTAFDNVIIKFGRYIPNSEPRWDEVLGVELASRNQYAEKIC